jgi:biopolymer transport protein ExbD
VSLTSLSLHLKEAIMTWSVRHQGSSSVAHSLGQAEVIAGLRDGVWDSSDEVLGVGETRWMTLESHPQFSDVVADLEANTPILLTADTEEERIDMNPLIDVCLVLLVFFILATTYQLMDRVHDLPTNHVAAEHAIPRVPIQDIRDKMILVQLRPGPGGAMYRVQDEIVPAATLEATLKRHVQGQRQEVVIDAKDVEWGAVVTVIDAAAGAKVRKVHFKADRLPE